ncbi:MAG: DUF1841 family protein [Betaproteobacteria bacterium]|nr:DUF1841 family protein [Betaproteobacteria bacterium]
MFNPSREQVRLFFFDAWREYRNGAALAGTAVQAVNIALMHPEYHGILDAPERYLNREWTPEDGQTNPFLHMSMHLAIEEQRSIDQPPGIVAAMQALEAQSRDPHAAQHVAMECLGEMVWRAQRAGTAPDALQYLDCLRRLGR